MTARLGGFVEAHGRALLLIVLSMALAGILFTFDLPIAIFPQTDFPRIVVLVDPGKLNGYGIPPTRVVDAIRNNNIIAPAGMIQENYHLYLMTVTGLMRRREQIESAVVDVIKGTPVLIKDLARVVDGERPRYNIVTAGGRSAVLINVLQQPDGNAVEIADAINRELGSIRRSLPGDVELSVFYDQSVLVRDSIHSVVDSIIIGLLLSIGVLVAFLKSWRTTVVAALVIPIATLMAIVFMKLFHMSFNLMTLGGLAACIGVVIDDAIVKVENIVVHLSLGQSPKEAAGSAIQELTPALIGSTLTPIVVFVPLVFLGGITAVFFRALAMTLVTALLASLFLAEKVAEWLPKIQGVVDLVNRTVVIGPTVNLRVDLQKARLAGFGVSDVAALESAILDGELASNMIRDDRLIGIRVRYPQEYRSSIEKIKSLLITSPTGNSVPLSSIAEAEMEEGKREIHRDHLRNLSSVTAHLSGRDLGSAMEEIRNRLHRDVAIPPGTEIEFGAGTRSSRNLSGACCKCC